MISHNIKKKISLNYYKILAYCCNLKIILILGRKNLFLYSILSLLGIMLFNLLCFSTADASNVNCGDPPPVADEEIKAGINGQARLLLRFIADTSLSGNIEKSRKEIFSKYPDANMAYSNAFLLYQFCVVLLSDPRPSFQEKIEALTNFKREFGNREYYKTTPNEIKELAQQSNPREEITDAINDENYQDAADMLFSDYYNMANNDSEKKDYPHAIENYRKALKIRPDHFGAYYNLGDSYRKTGEIDQSIMYFQKASEITPNNSRAHYNLGNLYQQKGEDNKAKEHYKRVIPLEPEGSDLSRRAKRNLQVLGE